jgi:hypothetical protein
MDTSKLCLLVSRADDRTLPEATVWQHTRAVEVDPVDDLVYVPADISVAYEGVLCAAVKSMRHLFPVSSVRGCRA